MHRSAPRLARILACATVPVVLVAGCSSGSDSEDKKNTEGSARSSSPSASPTIAAAKFSKLPDVCSTLSGKTIDKIVPKAKAKKGKALPSADTNTSASCLWSGLDGFDYRSLTVSLKLFHSDAQLGSGDRRAGEYAAQQASKAATAGKVTDPKTEKVAGIGDEATTVSTKEKKDGDDFRDQTVVARTANVVITLEYDGAGYETAKTPDAADLLKDAKSATKEVVGSVAKGAGSGA
ncbi:hypothetical protein PS467_23300 [Streptomyces luomodiensis]|uniref:DUF3558 domain-containing protein n=1 Tax=Streptomyces luomodiensis TaxID=3026192 RepID=A0ABY9V068_9ACTN|nr:hypothetical protein [Streptomyces sp. SCA4-21]WNE98041.1 hypothetical protein PS467_23300 [Streptomyces sp. SCA4-21]